VRRCDDAQAAFAAFFFLAALAAFIFSDIIFDRPHSELAEAFLHCRRFAGIDSGVTATGAARVTSAAFNAAYRFF
jgi:hypothetical protein